MSMTTAPVIALVACCVALALFFFFRWRRSNEASLTFKTMFGKAHVFTTLQDERTGLHASGSDSNMPEVPIRVLELSGTLQSATYLYERCYELVFNYFRCFNRVFETPLAVRNVLMLGGGGYAWPKYVISHHPETRMDVVEIDPTITSIAERYFYLDRLIVEFDTEQTGRLGLICDDALHYLRTTEEAYDVIVDDCFVRNQIDGPLENADAISSLRARLVPGGIFAANVISAIEGDNARVTDLARLLKEEFAHAWVLPCEQRPPEQMGNNIVFATDSAYQFRGAWEL